MQLKFFHLFIFIGICISQYGHAKELTAKEVSGMEKKLVNLVNRERVKHGLHPLGEWKILYPCAQQHSTRMAKKKVSFGHSGFEKRAEKIRQLARVGTFGENLAYCRNVDDPLSTSIAMWMKSPSHRDNILDANYTDTAIAITVDKQRGIFITQLFAKRL